MLPRTSLVRIQRALTLRLKQYLRQFIGDLSPSLKRYFKEYQRDLGDFKSLSTRNELIEDILKSKIVFLGDYHTLAQAQRTVLRLLKASLPQLRARKQGIALALEMLRVPDQRAIDSFLAGKINEQELIEAIDFHAQWGFPWENYRELLLFAIEEGLSVIGLSPGRKNSIKGLKARDQYAAEVLGEYLEDHSENLVFVLIGDLHLAEAHLPREVEREMKARKVRGTLLTVHQNVESFYWKLVAKGLDHLVEVVKIRDRNYCVMSAPPWIKLQSHLKWAELVSEEGEHVSATGEVATLREPQHIAHELDYAHEVRELVEVIRNFIKAPSFSMDDFTVMGPMDSGFLKKIARQGGYNALTLKTQSRCLREFDSHFFPQEKIIFIRSLNLNHLAMSAGHYLHTKLSGFSRVFNDPKENFYPFVWFEALGFLGSKVINPKRKCNGPSELQALVENAETSGEHPVAARAARKALKFLELEGRKELTHPKIPSSRLTPHRLIFYYRVSRVLGRILGQAIYLAAMDNRVSAEEVLELFRNPFTDSRAAVLLYFKWIRKLDRFGYRHVSKASL